MLSIDWRTENEPCDRLACPLMPFGRPLRRLGLELGSLPLLGPGTDETFLRRLFGGLMVKREGVNG